MCSVCHESGLLCVRKEENTKLLKHVTCRQCEIKCETALQKLTVLKRGCKISRLCYCVILFCFLHVHFWEVLVWMIIFDISLQPILILNFCFMYNDGMFA